MNRAFAREPRARLWFAIAAALVLPASSFARNVGAGENVTVVPADAPESWLISGGNNSFTMAPGANSFDIRAYDTLLTIGDGAIVAATATGNVAGVTIGNGTQATITGATISSATGTGLLLAGALGPSATARVTMAGGSITGATYGASTGAGYEMTLDHVSLSGTGSATSIGGVVFNGYMTVTNGTTVTGQLHGIRLRTDNRGASVIVGSHLMVDGSTIRGIDGSGIIVDTLNPIISTDAYVTVRNNGLVQAGGSGAAVEVTQRTTLDMTVDDSTLEGDVRVADGGTATLGMTNGAILQGNTTGALALALASGSEWRIGASSDVSSMELSGGSAAFAAPSPGSPRALTVRGDLSGTGGVVGLHTVLDQGGALSSQQTDRLLVEGNVTSTGPVELVVTGSGQGALTDINQNGMVDAGEGMSLVQVGGTSRPDAFALRGTYVAAGAFQYTLHAFGPGQTDAAQNALANGVPLTWDYRLGNTYVCEGDCDPVTPVDPPVDPPIDPPVNPPVEPPVVDPDPGDGGREAVVPQLPSYLSAPAALLSYGDMLNDGLHQRLGELRNGTSSDPLGGEVFARYLGGQLRYTSNLSFERYGYDFDQQVNALQIGGSLIALDGDNGSLRAGWAADQGTTRVTPKAADGDSSAKYHANGLTGWMTWQHGSGFWVDGVIGATRYRGDIGTDLRGADVARIRANGWTMSIEAGMPLALGPDWTVEPRFQLKHQALNFRDFTDVDGLDVTLGTAKQTSATLGARIMRSANARFMPYAGVDLTHTSNGDPTANVSSTAWNASDRFGSGRVGNAYRVSAGAVSQLTDHVQVYGEGHYQHFVGSYGMRGWAGNLGVRVTF